MTIPVLANDTDPNGDTLALTASVNGSHGTTQAISVNGTSQIVYTPTTGYVGSDSFTYTIAIHSERLQQRFRSLSRTQIPLHKVIPTKLSPVFPELSLAGLCKL